MKIFSVQDTGITVRQDYTFEGALILQELKVCYKKLYINQMQERKCPGRGIEASRHRQLATQKFPEILLIKF